MDRTHVKELVLIHQYRYQVKTYYLSILTHTCNIQFLYVDTINDVLFCVHSVNILNYCPERQVGSFIQQGHTATITIQIHL